MSDRFSYSQVPPASQTKAPMLSVTLRSANLSVTELALIDSGSDVTTITEKVRNRLGLEPKGVTKLSGAISSDQKKTQLYVADIEFCGRTYANRPVYLLEHKQYMLIGRDIINSRMLSLDGPSEELTVHP